MTKYKEIMSEVSVTPEMRDRVLKNVANRENHQAKKNKKIPLRRLLPVLAAACMLMFIGIQLNKPNQPVPDPEMTSNSITEYKTEQQLEQAIGFDMPELDALPFEVTKTEYSEAFDVARVEYHGAKKESVTLSKAKSYGSDISGDNNEYKTVKKENIGGAKVTLKGKGESVYVATWENGGYSYAMTASPGLKDPTMKALILSVVERS